MSFLGGMFGGSGSGCDEDKAKNCECNKMLKDHLKKCAGLGERPPLVESCAVAKDMDPCKAMDLSGPPTCKGCTPAPDKCCPPPTPKITVFVPKCVVPPTATFKCPADNCGCPPPPKPKCCPPPETKCCNQNPSKCPEVVSSDGKKLSGGCGNKNDSCSKPKKPSGGGSCGASGSGSENSCEPRPLYMEQKKC